MQKAAGYIIKFENVKDFDIMHTFECGQCFRWNHEEDGSYTGIAGGRVANVRYDDEILIIEYPAEYPADSAKCDSRSDDVPKECISSGCSADECPDTESLSDRCSATECLSGKCLAGECLPGGCLPDGCLPDGCLPDEFLPDGCLPDECPDRNSAACPDRNDPEKHALRHSREKDFWHEYFDLGRDYGKIKDELSKDDEIMKAATAYGSGIRLLRQDPWETVISFIISQNSNIPRIKSCIEKLCSLYGDFVCEWRGKRWYDFPKASTLAALMPEDLAACKLGYRDKYVIAAAQKIMKEDVHVLAAAEEKSRSDVHVLAAAEGKSKSDESLKYLRGFLGVGPKVAECINLFGLKHYDSFPLDVWMKRIMSRLYGFDENDVRSMKNYARKHFGKYSGFAQQYLFYYARENL